MKTTFHAGLKNDDVQTSASQVNGAAKVFDAFGNELSSTGAWNSQFGYAGKFGYQQDADSGLKLLGHRYYDSSVGRFLTRDPIKDGRNWCGYCGNRPIDTTDPSGLQFKVLPPSPQDLLDKGWTQGKHGGGQRQDGGMGRYYPPGVNGKGPGLEFHPGTPGAPGHGGEDHWHEVDKNGKKQDPHLDPGNPMPDSVKRPQKPEIADSERGDRMENQGNYGHAGSPMLSNDQVNMLLLGAAALGVFLIVTSFTGGIGAPVAAAAAAGIIGGAIVSGRGTGGA
ncbi:hypothetical protein C0431_04255 [bacterium]|nr:hypothetical protein [bacterium]